MHTGLGYVTGVRREYLKYSLKGWKHHWSANSSHVSETCVVLFVRVGTVTTPFAISNGSSSTEIGLK